MIEVMGLRDIVCMLIHNRDSPIAYGADTSSELWLILKVSIVHSKTAPCNRPTATDQIEFHRFTSLNVFYITERVQIQAQIL